MEKKSLDYAELKEAKRIFADSANYTDEQIIGYYRLIRDLIRKYGYLDVKFINKKNLEFKDKSEFICELEQITKQLCNSYIRLIELRYFKGYSLNKIADELGCSIGAISAKRARTLHNLHLLRKKYEIVKWEKYRERYKQEKKAKILEDLKNGRKPWYDLELEYFEFYFKLDKKFRNILTFNGITTICKLLDLKEENFSKCSKVGVKTTQKLLKLQQKLLNGELE